MFGVRRRNGAVIPDSEIDRAAMFYGVDVLVFRASVEFFQKSR